MPKGIQGFQKGNKSRLGMKHSIKTKQKMRIAALNSKNHNWKGDNVSYNALHAWVRVRLGTPNYCAYCQSTEAKIYDWANLSHAYKRDLDDWIRLCRKCHIAFDKGKINL